MFKQLQCFLSPRYGSLAEGADAILNVHSLVKAGILVVQFQELVVFSASFSEFLSQGGSAP